MKSTASFGHQVVPVTEAFYPSLLTGGIRIAMKKNLRSTVIPDIH
jgi:hypothetical protein